jgi:hypothetical protein
MYARKQRAGRPAGLSHFTLAAVYPDPGKLTQEREGSHSLTILVIQLAAGCSEISSTESGCAQVDSDMWEVACMDVNVLQLAS